MTVKHFRKWGYCMLHLNKAQLWFHYSRLNPDIGVIKSNKDWKEREGAIFGCSTLRMMVNGLWLSLNNQTGSLADDQNQLENKHRPHTLFLVYLVHYYLYYLCHFLFWGKEVMIGEIHHVWTWDDGQSFGEMVAVWEIQVEHIADLWMLQNGETKFNREVISKS